MKTKLPLSLLLLGALLASCGPSPPPPPPPAPAGTIVKLSEGPTAVENPTTVAPQIAPPQANQTLYLVHVQDAQGRAIKGARVMLLTEMPEPLYLREPRKKTRIRYVYTPDYGRAEFMVQSDGLPKYLLVGGDGFKPDAQQVDPSTGGHTQELRVVTEILPIANFVIKDHTGDRVADALVTMRPLPGESNKYAIRGLKPNEGMTERGDDFGIVTFTRPLGSYELMSMKGDGTCRKYEIFAWDGRKAEIVIQLPEKSETPPAWVVR